MIRLFLLLLAACFTGHCMKQQQQQYDIQSNTSEPGNAAVNINNAVRHVRSASSGDGGSCSGQYQQLNYPCNNRSSDASVCEDTGPAIENGYRRNVVDNCCCDSQCPNSDITDEVASANDSDVMWLAHNDMQATLMVNWTRSSSGSTRPVGYQLWVYINGVDSTKLRCIHLPPSITSYTANVTLTLSFNVIIKLFSVSRADEQPYRVNNVLNVKAKIPHYCWDLKGASVERCGPMFASAPQNLTVTGTLVNQSSVMLHISWTPPAQYTPDIEAYKISISGNCYCNNGTTLQYVTVESADVSSYIVKVSASSGRVTSYHGVDRYSALCCDSAYIYNYWGSYASVTYNLLTSTTTTTTTSTTTTTTTTISSSTVTMVTDTVMTNTMATLDSIISTSSSAFVTVTSSSVITDASTNTSSTSTVDRTNHGTLIIILAVLVTTAVILLILMSIMIAVYLRQKRRAVYSLAPTLNESHPPKVFIVTDSDLQLVRELCHRLAITNIDQVYYQYVENDRHNGPGQLGIPAWTQKCFTESDMVLFVCNRGFNIVWENKPENRKEITGHDPYTLIISTVRQLFEGYLTEYNRHSKYAVILLQGSDHQHIPSLLKNFRSFLVSDQEALARYILQIPEYAAPLHRTE